MESRKNILFISSWYPSKNNPTNGNFVEKHAECVSIDSNIYVIHVEIHKKSFVVKNKKSDSLTEILYYIKPHPFKVLNGIKKGLFYLKKCSEYIHNNDISLIHVNVIRPIGLVALLLKIKHRIPYLIVEHSTIYQPQRKKEFTLPIKLLSRLVSKNAEIISPVSNDLAEAMKKNKIKGNYSIIENVVDTSLFNIAVVKPTSHCFNLIHISSIKDEHKNFSGILRTISTLINKGINIKFTTISDGDYNYYKSIFEELQIPENRLILYDEKTPEEISNLLKYQDALIMFSNYENAPCVISESLCCGIPVLSTNVGGISEMINESNGILVDLKNENQLEESIIAMINNYKKFDSEKICANAKQKYSYESVSSKFNHYYSQIVNA